MSDITDEKEEVNMSWTRQYHKIPVPERDPCERCRRNVFCDEICPARAKWWDRSDLGRFWENKNLAIGMKRPYNEGKGV